VGEGKMGIHNRAARRLPRERKMNRRDEEENRCREERNMNEEGQERQ
jgi:hypothetical protein